MRLRFLLAIAPPLAGCVAISDPDTKPLPEPQPVATEVDHDCEAPRPVAVEGEHIHEPSGARFPLKVRAFKRVGVDRYDEEGRNVSAGYNLLKGPFAVAATMYVYPRPAVSSFLAAGEMVDEFRKRVAQRELAGNVQAILQGHREDSIREISRAPYSIDRPGGVRHGTKVLFDLENALGTPGMRGTTHLYLFADGEADWFVKFRFTHPRGMDFSGAIETLLRELGWPGE